MNGKKIEIYMGLILNGLELIDKLKEVIAFFEKFSIYINKNHKKMISFFMT